VVALPPSRPAGTTRNGWKEDMKKWIGIGLVVTAAALAAVSPAQACACGPKPKKCSDGQWQGVSKLSAPKGTSCATARNVLDKWMSNDGLEGTVRLRVGRDGVLWKCYGSRAYGKLNPWYINCSLSQRTWHHNRKYSYSWYSDRSMWFEYRDR
jgi:hypothetical protein